jgi:hypothetical protein
MRDRPVAEAGFEPAVPSKRGAADIRLKRRGRRDRLVGFSALSLRYVTEHLWPVGLHICCVRADQLNKHLPAPMEN